jgi:CPA2 family monovalent cation:H+ antiporter-2
LAGAVVSIALNPVVFGLISPVQQWILKRSRMARFMNRSRDRLAELPHSISPSTVTDHVLIVGYGRVGRRITERLIAQGIRVVVAEQNRELVAALRSRGIPSVAGDATDPAVLIQAHVSRAKVLVIATPDTIGLKAMTDIAHKLQPNLPVIVRTHSDDEAEDLRKEPHLEVYMGEAELAQSMTRAVLEHAQKPLTTE